MENRKEHKDIKRIYWGGEEYQAVGNCIHTPLQSLKQLTKIDHFWWLKHPIDYCMLLNI